MASALSHPARRTRTRRMRSWPLRCPQLLRCIIQPKEGLIQVMRLNENGATNVPARSAASAMRSPYAW